MAYSDDIVNAGADHRWKFDGNSTDDIGALASNNTGVVFTGTVICEDTINSMQTNGTNDHVTSTTSSDTSFAANDILYAGWFMTDSIQQPPCRIIGDGGTTASMAIYLGFGNGLLFEVDDTSASPLQIYGDTPIVEGRPYHLAVGYNSSNEIVAYLDGVLQTDSADTTGIALPTSRNAISFAGTSTKDTFSIGGTTILLVSPVNGFYNQWCTFHNSIPSTVTIREELFEKGALADDTITNQTGLNVLNNSTRANSPCNIRVDVVGNLDLTADNITFDPLASIHVQYMGTGTLNWTNTNGSNASIGSTPNGGTINFINSRTLTIDGLIDGCEIRIYDYETQGDGSFDIELDGVESNSGIYFNFNHSGLTNLVVVQMIASGYKEIIREFTLGSEDQTLTLFPEVEDNA